MIFYQQRENTFGLVSMSLSVLLMSILNSQTIKHHFLEKSCIFYLTFSFIDESNCGLKVKCRNPYLGFATLLVSRYHGPRVTKCQCPEPAEDDRYVDLRGHPKRKLSVGSKRVGVLWT